MGQALVTVPILAESDRSPSPWAKRGFTLIELLVVAGVIAILASLLLPTLSRAKNAARNTQCQSNLRQWGLALLLYVDDFRAYPPAFTFDASGRVQAPEEVVAGYFGSH